MNKPSSYADIMRYELAHQGTQLGTGQFACLPQEPLDFEDALQCVWGHPNDDFMHKYLLHLAGQFGPNLTRQLIQRAREEGDRHLMTLMYESCILNERLSDLTSEFSGVDRKELARYTPLIYVNWSLARDRSRKDPWLRLFSENIQNHIPLSDPNELDYPFPLKGQAIDAWTSEVVSIGALVEQRGGVESTQDLQRRVSPVETSARAMERLEHIGLQIGPETENAASFSPHAIQMQWVLQVKASAGRNHWELAGLQTSYGKGLTSEDARASCRMEVVERVSSFASFDSKRALHYKKDHLLVRASYEALKENSAQVLDPNEWLLEVAYENQPLHWIGAERIDERGPHSVFVPAQLVFLFCNLDEVSLTGGLPSTGLASGNTLEEAKLHALLEVIERDSERIMPFVPERCFLLESDIPGVKEVQRRSREAGVEVVFLDITSELGVPCYKAFVQGPEGQILKGCGAHLDGKRAALSALTEVPFHSSWFCPSPPPNDLKVTQDRNLPDYSSGQAGQDLQLLENLLMVNGYRPIYVDLTRKDVDIPVVKALVPGLELFAEFDQFSNLGFRQFAHYWEALNKP